MASEVAFLSKVGGPEGIRTQTGPSPQETRKRAIFVWFDLRGSFLEETLPARARWLVPEMVKNGLKSSFVFSRLI
jgi:hypothetical protein